MKSALTYVKISKIGEVAIFGVVARRAASKARSSQTAVLKKTLYIKGIPTNWALFLSQRTFATVRIFSCCLLHSTDNTFSNFTHAKIQII
ncbi:MAG: hypothetical protein GY820_09185 [Gammaproteobacteria bacterium]|nr:hypothetical protein [Gammaproteobacteria bacterium]